jgi:hypothetical protein
VADAPRPPAEAAHAVAALAALVDGRHLNHRQRGRRPVRKRLDGWSVELPGPVVLAEIMFPVLNAGRDLRSDRGSLVDFGGPEPAAVGLAEVTDAARAFVAALPDDGTAGRPYKDLRLFAAEAPPEVVSAYVADVARAVRQAAPPAPVPERAPRERLSPEQRAANYRESQRRYAASVRAEIREYEADDQEDAACYLFEYQERTGPGVVVAPKALHKQYTDNQDGTTLGRNKFFRVADAVVGPRTRRRIDGKPQPAYVTQEVPTMTRQERKELARLVVQQIAEKWEVEARAGLSDLLADLASPSTATGALPSNVVPLRRAV